MAEASAPDAPASDPAAAPPPAAPTALLFVIFALWSLALGMALTLVEGLAYICTVSPPPDWRTGFMWVASVVIGTAVPVRAYTRLAPTSALRRLGATLLGTFLASVLVLVCVPIPASFDIVQRIVVGGVCWIAVALPASFLAWLVLEGALWVRARLRS
jgi:hypothetical protein